MRQRILGELCQSPGAYVSGKELAEKLGISRVAVWKHIENLKGEGYAILGVSGKGYCIEESYNVLLLDSIKAALSTARLDWKLHLFPELDSTNEMAKKLIREGQAAEGTVIISRQQSRGKGRRGRSWQSPLGGLWFSIILRPELALSEVVLLSLVFAVAISQALDSFQFFDPQMIKWPNDVYINGKKVAGILLELSGELEQADYLVVGIGINVNMDRASLGRGLAKTATSLWEESGTYYQMGEVLLRVLQSIEEYYYEFLKNGFEDIRKEYKSRCFHLGKMIRLDTPRGSVEGLNLNIDEQGNLIIDSGDSIECLNTGDVALLAGE
ncbi:biotin--[acetyl-CoA-carboxylase] ligase [Syntrophomonas wolfei]|uniref:Bifunctional ligase/repressor BirA n=1 Tax=Syntrophomonas wolfei subsp. wolfei (strain DSM 2245B / Goettingen) TaxID=335541 RepID=Q0AYV8_SYNWW|nr:biotin--[acetyl-CoA-carboxylase] ligase [Syntrophomonas wolfei]ABI68096.1 transcriptional repressor of the biotin operon / biotin acetyl-CoA-carboxylase synthetase; RBL03563 [Syntrophomonas wolfei subsp. wolfei str. Goettingen G311]